MQRILVIDDDPAVTSLLKRGLSYEGFAVETAPSEHQGLEYARERPPDLVILDVTMSFPFEVMLAGVHSQLRRRQVEHPAVLRFADLSLDTGSHRVYRGQRAIALTSIEFKLLLFASVTVRSIAPTMRSTSEVGNRASSRGR